MGDDDTRTCRGTTYDGKTIRLQTRGLSTVAQCVLSTRPLVGKETAKKRAQSRNGFLSHLKATGNAGAKKGGRPSGLWTRTPPPDVNQIRGAVWFHEEKQRKLRAKIAALDADAPEENRLYMGYLAARLRAAWLCFWYTFITLERNQAWHSLILETNIFIRDEDEVAALAPVGAEARAKLSLEQGVG